MLGIENEVLMRMQFKSEGGLAAFPGLSRAVTIESEQLPEQEARELERLVAATRFFDLVPEASARPAGAADMITYTVTAEDGGRRHTVHLSDLMEDADIQQLLAFLKAKAKVARRPQQ